MNTTIKEKEPQTVTVKLEVTFTLENGMNIISAMDAATDVIAKANELGRATGTVVIGRQKFAL